MYWAPFSRKAPRICILDPGNHHCNCASRSFQLCHENAAIWREGLFSRRSKLALGSECTVHAGTPQAAWAAMRATAPQGRDTGSPQLEQNCLWPWRNCTISGTLLLGHMDNFSLHFPASQYCQSVRALLHPCSLSILSSVDEGCVVRDHIPSLETPKERTWKYKAD
jgi:hypothetical protein